MVRDHGTGTVPKKFTKASSSSALQKKDKKVSQEATTTSRGHARRGSRSKTSETEAERKARLDAEIDREIEEALQAETEEEEEPPQGKKRVKRADTTPTYTKLLDHLKNNIKWAPMRFPDTKTLQQLGILEDVRTILQNMGMESLLNMSYPVHKEVSCQFLASFDLVHHYEEDDEEGWGYITFKVKGRMKRVGFSKLSSIFDLSDERESFLPPSNDISRDVWALIVGDRRIAGSDKCNEITNPAVRYVAKILSHTFYSRREPGGVNDDELKFLGLGLLPLVDEERLPNTQKGDFHRLGLVGILMRRLNYYKEWAWTNSDSKAKLFIGSLITPILAALEIDLGPMTAEPSSIDLPYLQKTFFLGGRKGDRFAYEFNSTKDPYHHSYIFLPNEPLTTVHNEDNIFFDPEYHHLVPEDHSGFEIITTSRKRKPRASTSRASRHSDAGDDRRPKLYGTRRYDFEPYRGTTSSIALSRALSQNEKLLRWNRMQDSTIYKLKNSVKALKRQMKKVTSLLSHVSIGSGCQREDILASTSALPHPSYYDPPRSPNYALHRQRRNTSPPPRHSSNESPSVATADDYDTEGASSFA